MFVSEAKQVSAMAVPHALMLGVPARRVGDGYVRSGLGSGLGSAIALATDRRARRHQLNQQD